MKPHPLDIIGVLLVWLALGGCVAKTQSPVAVPVPDQPSYHGDPDNPDMVIPILGTGATLIPEPLPIVPVEGDIVVHEVTFSDDDTLGLVANIPMHPEPGNYWIISRQLIGDWNLYVIAWGWGDINTLGDRRHIRVLLEPKLCYEWYVDDEVATSDFLQVVFVSETNDDLEAMKELLKRGGGIEVLRDPRSDL